MNFNEVKELVSMIDSSSLKSFELTLDNCNIKMNKTGNAFSNNSVQSETINVGTPVVSAPAVSMLYSKANVVNSLMEKIAAKCTIDPKPAVPERTGRSVDELRVKLNTIKNYI